MHNTDIVQVNLLNYEGSNPSVSGLLDSKYLYSSNNYCGTSRNGTILLILEDIASFCKEKLTNNKNE